MKKSLFLLTFLFLTGAFFVVPAFADAQCQEHEIWGWAWSETIGWISFSCQNETAIGAGVDYGVDINEGTDTLTGYAWSKNIGWIDFSGANIDVSGGTGSLSGQAQACSVFEAGCSGDLKDNSERGGWDGKIALSGTADNGDPYGVTLNSGVAPAEFENWAWGDDVVGWISFNGNNEPGGADYAVYTSGLEPVNSSPTATISCEDCSGNLLNPCEAFQGDSLCLINNSADPDGADDIVLSEWYTKDVPGGDFNLHSNCVGICDASGFVTIGDFEARLYIEDSISNSAEAFQDFTIKRDISAGFMCSVDNSVGSWENCDDIIVPVGDSLYFKDDNSLAEYSRPSDGALISSRTWEEVGSGAFDLGNNTNPGPHVISSASIIIRLIVNDTNGRSTSASHIIGGAIPLPAWHEIAPYF